MKGSAVPRDSSNALEPVQKALQRLFTASSESRLRAAAIEFAHRFCEAPGGEEILNHYGGFACRNTAPGTPYAAARDRAKKTVRPEFLPWPCQSEGRGEERDRSLRGLKNLSESIARILRNDRRLRADCASGFRDLGDRELRADESGFVGLKEAESPEQQLRRALTDEETDALEGWQLQAEKLVSEMERWPLEADELVSDMERWQLEADELVSEKEHRPSLGVGCEFLLHLYRCQGDTFVAAAISTSAKYIKPAAKFLVKRLKAKQEEQEPPPPTENAELAGVGEQADEPHEDGPERPRFFWWKRIRYELDIEPKPFALLEYVWERHRAGVVSVKVADIGGRVWGHRNTSYNTIKPHVSKVNTALAGCGIPVSLSKPVKTDSVTLSIATG
jgi:hypothetical protein